MIDRNKTRLPIQDGDVIHTTNRGAETVGGEIKPPHEQPICWTIQGNWYRRSDGEEMTVASGTVTTVRSYFQQRRKQRP